MNILLFADEVGKLESSYPRRMYALPVPSRTLVDWPMLYGGVVVTLLWVTGAYLINLCFDVRAPVLLPALFLAAALAWLQAFTWAPIRHPLLHLGLGLGFFPVLVALHVWIHEMSKPAQGPFAAMLVTYIAAAYAVARLGVASNRRGDTWHVLPRKFLSALSAAGTIRPRRPYHSPGEAQLWYEWDCHGFIVPTVGALFLLPVLAPDMLLGRRTTPNGFLFECAFLVIIPVMCCGTSSTTLGSLRRSAFGERSRAFITFLATRPVTTGALVAAKFRMAARSVLLMYAIAVVEGALFLWVVAADYAEFEKIDLWPLFLHSFPGWRAAAVVLLGAVTVPALTWGVLTAGFAVVLTGRDRLVVLFNLAVMAGGLSLGFAVLRFDKVDPDAVLPLLSVAAAIKAVLVTWAFHACLRRGLMSTPTLIGILAASLAISACSMALAVLLLPAEWLPVSKACVLLGVMLLVPLEQFALAPLALDWNRHR